MFHCFIVQITREVKRNVEDHIENGTQKVHLHVLVLPQPITLVCLAWPHAHIGMARDHGIQAFLEGFIELLQLLELGYATLLWWLVVVH